MYGFVRKSNTEFQVMICKLSPVRAESTFLKFNTAMQNEFVCSVSPNSAWFGYEELKGFENIKQIIGLKQA